MRGGALVGIYGSMGGPSEHPKGPNHSSKSLPYKLCMTSWRLVTLLFFCLFNLLNMPVGPMGGLPRAPGGLTVIPGKLSNSPLAIMIWLKFLLQNN